MSSGAVWPQALLRQRDPTLPRTDADTAPPDFHVLRRGVAAGAAALTTIRLPALGACAANQPGRDVRPSAVL